MASYRHISHGFDPVFDERSRILVLGSFPSVLSRKNDFYYGNPRNRFWDVMAACLERPVPPNEGEPVGDADADGTDVHDAARHSARGRERAEAHIATLEDSIAAKRNLLLDGGIALWDVIESCDIKGSSDASIKNVVPIDVSRVLATGRIGAVICNGATAGRLYKRYLEWEVGLAAHVLPSTSPANAAWSLERLAQRWREELVSLLAAAADGTLGAAAPRTAPASANEGRGRTDYAVVRIPTPPASNWAVRKSMQGNKCKNTKPELLVREKLRDAGLGGYRLQWKAPGHPDIAWPGKRVAIEVRGCYWHRCPHCNPSIPKKNVPYWEAKFARNVERDAENLAALEAVGWRVHVIWECELKKKTLDATLEKLLPQLAEELGKELAASCIATREDEGDETTGNESEAVPDGESTASAAAEGGTSTAALDEPKATPTGKPVAVAAEPSPTESAVEHPHFMYVLECGDGSLYTGYTTDVPSRLVAHRAGKGAKYTRNRGPLNLLASAEFATKHEAMSAEYRFKRLTRDQKDALLAQAAKPEADFATILKQALFT